MYFTQTESMMVTMNTSRADSIQYIAVLYRMEAILYGL